MKILYINILNLLFIFHTVVCVAAIAENVKTAPAISAKKAAPTTRDNEETAATQTSQPCDGIPLGLKVDPRVQEFLSCDIIQILAQPERVESFQVKLIADPSVPEKNRLGNSLIAQNGQGRNLTQTEIKDLQKLFFAESSYYFGMEKRCRFRPDTGLHFVKGNQSVEVILSFSCDLWLFIHKNEQKLEDFDSIHQQLLTLRNTLFSTE